MKRITTLAPLPARPADGHKGTFGRLLVIGGSATMIGAPAYCGLAAYHAGCGYVQIGAPAETLLATLSLCPQAIGLVVPGDEQAEAIDKADAIAIGPGLGKLPAAKKVLEAVLTADKPKVLDADALNLISEGTAWPANVVNRCVLTPHPGEMKRLGKLFGKAEQSATDESDRVDTATRAADAFRQIVVLKGHRTIVTDGTRVYINRTGSSALAKAGSGDILSGISGAMLGQQNVDPFDAACMSVWIHGKAGEIAGRRVGERSTMATDIIAGIGEAIEQYQQEFGTVS